MGQLYVMNTNTLIFFNETMLSEVRIVKVELVVVGVKDIIFIWFYVMCTFQTWDMYLCESLV